MAIDLQTNASISQIDMTTNLVKGSEIHYWYTIMGSWGGSYYIQLVDGSTNTAVGFVSNKMSSPYKFRYIKVNVHNGNEADWARGIDEFMTYGGAPLNRFYAIASIACVDSSALQLHQISALPTPLQATLPLQVLQPISHVAQPTRHKSSQLLLAL